METIPTERNQWRLLPVVWGLEKVEEFPRYSMGKSRRYEGLFCFNKSFVSCLFLFLNEITRYYSAKKKKEQKKKEEEE